MTISKPDNLAPLYFNQCLFRAIECLESDERVLIELTYDNVFVEVRKIYMGKSGHPIADFKIYSVIANEYVERAIDLTPKTIKSFFFQ